MIIECVNCNKKFEVNSELIPSEGRTIQCGSCNHTWFFNKNDDFKSIFQENETEILSSVSDNQDHNKENKYEFDSPTEFIQNKINAADIKVDKTKSNFTLSKFLSYILIFIISFMALIIILDTFKTYMYRIFPSLEFILYSLFESLKDIKLFIKDLF